jgi:hypothetical protein
MRLALSFAALLLLASCSPENSKSKSIVESPEAAVAAPAPVEPAGRESAETRVEMVNVRIHLDPSLVVHIRRLSGKLARAQKNQAPSFDDKLSYIIAVDAAEIAIDTASMTHMMNTYVFGEPDAPLKNLRLSIKDGKVKQEGTIRKGPGVPFEMVGEMSPTPDGKIRIHPTHMRAGHLPVKGLMKLFGVDMAKIINDRNTRGISVDDNDLILDASLALPPPKMRGRITGVRIEGDQIVETFGEGKSSPAKPSSSNYMAYRGGVLRFGRLTMTDTDMRLVDADPSDPFDFSPDHYKEHLVGGYSKTTASGGLVVYMPDFSKISKKSLSPR